MKTVKEMITALLEFPMDANCHAYEGEVTALVISRVCAQQDPMFVELGQTQTEQLGVIHCVEG